MRINYYIWKYILSHSVFQKIGIITVTCIKQYVFEGPTYVNNNNNYNELSCANTLDDQAQWRVKTKGIHNFVIVNNV